MTNTQRNKANIHLLEEAMTLTSKCCDMTKVARILNARGLRRPSGKRLTGNSIHSLKHRYRQLKFNPSAGGGSPATPVNLVGFAKVESLLVEAAKELSTLRQMLN